MNLGLVAPSRLVSLRRISRTARHCDAERRQPAHRRDDDARGTRRAGQRRSCGPALLAQAARVVAYPAVRAFGTIGGSVAHADPAADYPVALVAANAAYRSRIGDWHASHRGPRFLSRACSRRRSSRARSSPPSWSRRDRGTAAPPTRSSRSLPVISPSFRWQRSWRKPRRIAIGGCGRSRCWRAACADGRGALREAAARLAAASDPPSDHRGSAAYRRKVLPELVCRAVRAARS